MEPLFIHAAALEGEAITTHLHRCICLGVGKTAAAVTLTRELATAPRPTAVILFGVAGAYPDRHRVPSATALRVLDTCVVSSDCFADEGVVTPTGFRSLSELGLGSIGPFESDRTLSERAATILRCPRVTAATVSSCSGDESMSHDRAQRSGASLESMEGAAVAFTCVQFGIPLLHLRTISNETGDRDRGGWDLGNAITRLQSALLVMRTALRSGSSD